MINEVGNVMRILVVFANAYDMPAEGTKPASKGCTVRYFFLGTDGSGLKPYSDALDAPVGYQPGKVSLDYDKRAKIPFAPAVYDGEFEMNVGADGKPVMKLKDLEYVSPFDIGAAYVASVTTEKNVVAKDEKGTGNK